MTAPKENRTTAGFLYDMLFLPVNYRKPPGSSFSAYKMTDEYRDFVERFGSEYYYRTQLIRDRFLTICLLGGFVGAVAVMAWLAP